MDLAIANPYKAIGLNKVRPQFNSIQLAELYLRVGQPAKAEAEIAPQYRDGIVPSTLIRKFIDWYAEHRDQAAVDRWIDKWQALTPRDVRWIHHVLLKAGLEIPQSVPPADTYTPIPWRVSKEIQRLVGAVNTVVAAQPHVLEDDQLVSLWTTSVSTPSYDSLLAVSECLATMQCTGFGPVLHHLKFDDAVRLLVPLTGLLQPDDYVYVLRKACTTIDVEKVLTVMPPEVVYVPQVLVEVGSRHPHALLELALPPEEPCPDFLILAYWRALVQLNIYPDYDMKTWLFPLTFEYSRSLATLRAGCTVCLLHKDWNGARDLLYHFVVEHGLLVDHRLVETLQHVTQTGKIPRSRWRMKLPRPTKGGSLQHFESIWRQIGPDR